MIRLRLTQFNVMKNIEYTNIKDFLQDTSFSNWVFKKRLSDVKFWNDWIQQNPNHQTLIEEAKNILLGIQFTKNDVGPSKIDLEWSKLEHIITERTKAKKRSAYSIEQRKFFRVAATFALLILSTIYFYRIPATVQHKTAYGEVLNIKLPDGTDVILNSNSSLSYKEENVRSVKLKGEAFFKVAKKISAKSKFWVQTKDLEVQVYGTEFNVNSRNKKTQVFLQEGAIELHLKNGNEKKMIPGDFISYSYASNSILAEKRPLRPELEISWKDGSLIFDRSTLKSAMSKIEDTYGLTAIFEDVSIENILLTGAVPTKNIDICIKTIEKSARVTITNKNNKLYITKN